MRYRIPGTPNLALYADHNRERQFVCRVCGESFGARTPNAKECGVCRGLTPRAKAELRERLRAAKEQA
jgi:hypothetical protein